MAHPDVKQTFDRLWALLDDMAVYAVIVRLLRKEAGL